MNGDVGVLKMRVSIIIKMILSNYHIKSAMNNLKCNISHYFWAMVFKTTNIIVLVLRMKK